MNDYHRVARIINYLDEHRVEQPDLEAVAREAGLSPSHCHRLFSRWAGVTPKDFLQCLTASHAKALLKRGESVLAAAVEAGLSGPGRLHDLCVNLEAASPGEIKSGGHGMTIRYGFAETPLGAWLVGESPRGICHISFLDGEEAPERLAELRAEWPKADLLLDDSTAEKLRDQAFEPGRGGGVNAFVRGTPFQVQVWRALLQVAPGSVVSYGALAAAVGHPGASRAVGSAVGDNPIALLIPCHRVIRQTGVIGEYRWGRMRKRTLLAWEAAMKMRIPGQRV